MVAPLGAGGAEQRLFLLQRDASGESVREEDVLSVVFQPLEAAPPAAKRKETRAQRRQRLQDEVSCPLVANALSVRCAALRCPCGCFPYSPREDSLLPTAAQLTEWRVAFAAKHGRKPTREDMFGDEASTQLFNDFNQLHQWR